MNKALGLRKRITAATNDKLSNVDIHDAAKSIRRRLVDFAHLQYEFS